MWGRAPWCGWWRRRFEARRRSVTMCPVFLRRERRVGQIYINDELALELAAFAKAHGLSVEEQAEDWLREALRRRATSRDLRAVFDQIAAISPKGTAQTDSVQLLREVRNR